MARPIRLTHPRPGDLGWIVERHGAIYADEYGWDGRFEGLVAEVVADYLREHDPARERVFIARRGEERLGCVMLVDQGRGVAKLRLMLVEPHARGLGLGKRLVDATLRFARRAGYRKIVLWTNDVLHPARRLYERAGFRMIGSEPYDGFGPPTRAETWELRL